MESLLLDAASKRLLKGEQEQGTPLGPSHLEAASLAAFYTRRGESSLPKPVADVTEKGPPTERASVEGNGELIGSCFVYTPQPPWRNRTKQVAKVCVLVPHFERTWPIHEPWSSINLKHASGEDENGTQGGHAQNLRRGDQSMQQHILQLPAKQHSESVLGAEAFIPGSQSGSEASIRSLVDPTKTKELANPILTAGFLRYPTGLVFDGASKGLLEGEQEQGRPAGLWAFPARPAGLSGH